MKQVSKTCQSAYLELVELAKLDMSSQLKLPKPLWHPWYCHALITVTLCCQGFLYSWLTNFKKFKIARSARLSFKTSKHAHVSPPLAKLHWLSIAQRIDYKIFSLCYNVILDTAPLYLSDLLRLYTPSRSLRSSADTHIFGMCFWYHGNMNCAAASALLRCRFQSWSTPVKHGTTTTDKSVKYWICRPRKLLHHTSGRRKRRIWPQMMAMAP